MSISRPIPNCITQYLLALFVVLCLGFNGCGGGSPPSNVTPPPAPISLSPTSAMLSLSGTQQFSVSGGAAVNWSVTGSGVGNATFGTISSSGLYTAPSNTSGIISITVTAALQSNPSNTASASVALAASGPISITPASATLQVPGTQQFTLVNASSNAVTWTVNHVSGGNSSVGTISSTGLYTAPGTIPSGLIDVTAISLADASKTADAAVTLQYPSPVVSSLSPAQLPQPSMSSNVTITATGKGFSGDSSVSLGGPSPCVVGNFGVTPPQITQLTTTSMQVVIPGSSLVSVGTYTLSVTNAPPGGGISGSTIQVTSGGALQMTTVRNFHTASPLANGKVLLAGGSGCSAASGGSNLATAELFDPTTQMFTPVTSQMATPRADHTATLLNDGTVLIAGGNPGGLANTTATAEIYDPATGVFASVGSMTTPRQQHAATLLQNGKVLITGGTDTNIDPGVQTQQLSSAELYDPSTKTFTATGSMSITRASHAATLLQDGRVLVTGGEWDLFFSRNFLNTAEVYDPSGGTFSSTGSMSSVAAQHTSTLLANGQVLVAGGLISGNPGGTSAIAQLYDPPSATFLNPTIAMIVARAQHTATLMSDGTVQLIGGTDDLRTELFDPMRTGFAQSVSLSVARQGHTATLLPGGKVLVTGGAQTPLAELVQ
jgi:hypothetical protein